MDVKGNSDIFGKLIERAGKTIDPAYAHAASEAFRGQFMKRHSYQFFCGTFMGAALECGGPARNAGA